MIDIIYNFLLLQELFIISPNKMIILSIFTFRWVLTARHCVESRTENADGSISTQIVPAANVTLALGAHDLTEGNINLTNTFK